VAKAKAKSPPAAYRLSARKSSGELSDSDSADTTPSGNKAKLTANVDITSSRFVRKPFKGYAYRRSGLRIRIHFIRIRIQHFRLNTDPDPDPIRIQGFNDQKLNKNYS
jgi:hypothetical protein